MAERQGFVYRRTGVTRAELAELLGPNATGWAWTSAFMYTRGAGRSEDLLRGTEGQAYRDGVELRWRPDPASTSGEPRFDVLVLALAEQPEAALPGFARIPPDGAPWYVEPTRMRLQHQLGIPPQQDDERRKATAFIAPDGSVQFVALIE